MSAIAERIIAQAVAVKKETTQGTWAAPTMAVDALRWGPTPPIFTWGFALIGKSDGFSTGGFGRPLSADPRARWGAVQISTPFSGSGVALTPPHLTRLFEPFMSVTPLVAEVDSVIVDTDQDTLSILVQAGEKEFQLRGATPERMVLRGAVGRPCFLETTYVGIMDVDPINKVLDAITYNNQLLPPPVPLGASILTLGGTALSFRSFELDFRLQAQTPREMVNGNVLAGLEPGLVTQVDPILRLPSKVVALATHDVFTRHKTPSSALALSLTIGSAVGSRWIITADHVEYDPEETGWHDEGSLFFYDLVCGVIRPSSGIWLRIRSN